MDDILKNITFEQKYHLNISYFKNPRRFGHVRLYQLGRAYCKKDTVVPRHSHLDFIELTIVTGGKGVITTNGVPVNVKSGDIYVSFMGDFHEIESDRSEELRYDFVALNTDNERMHDDIEDIVTRFHDADARIIKNENISMLISNAIAEINADTEYSDVILTSIFNQTFAYIIREFRSAVPIRYSKNASDAQILCYQIMNYIDSHIYSMKHLRELCDVTNYNYNYLSNLYKKVTSDTLMNYFRSRRLETARLLLSEHALSVTKVAQLLNYSSVYIFSRAFKERYGVPPSDIDKLEETP